MALLLLRLLNDTVRYVKLIILATVVFFLFARVFLLSSNQYYKIMKMLKRNILLWLYSFLIICNTLVTNSINIAIVSMVNQASTPNPNPTTDVVCRNTTFSWGESTDNEKNEIRPLATETYNWSSSDQITVLSGFYWLNWLAILPSSLLSQKYGSKIVLGYCMAICSLTSSLIPIFASTGPQTVTYIRVIQGFFSMAVVHGGSLTIIGNWIPPDERGKFTLICIESQIVSFALGSILFGYIAEYINWMYVFHLTSFFGLVWVILWYWLIYDTPETHPDISMEEKNYIIKSLPSSSDCENRPPFPWKDVLTSFNFYVCALCCAGIVWHFAMLTTYTPTYLKSMYGLNSNQIGFINSIPQFASGIGMLASGYILDIVVRKEWLSVTNSRKCFAGFGGAAAAIPLIIIAYTKCNIMLVAVCLTIATVARNVSNFGSGIAIIDMSPKFCGVLDGISGTLSSILTFVLTEFTNSLSSSMSTSREMWKIVFFSTGMMVILFSLLFVAFGSAEIQPWNYGPTKPKQNQEDSCIGRLKATHYGT